MKNKEKVEFLREVFAWRLRVGKGEPKKAKKRKGGNEEMNGNVNFKLWRQEEKVEKEEKEVKVEESW